jgi:hypothetical protein
MTAAESGLSLKLFLDEVLPRFNSGPEAAPEAR